jgi:hypothetical protein
VEDDPLTYSVSTPANGTAAVVADQLEYTPDLDFNGADSFTYTANDGTDDSAQATVTVTVDPVNDAPVADDQEVSTGFGVALDITLTGSDVDGDDLTFAVVDQPLHGTLTGTAPDLTYTPEDGYSGTDSFTFQANDGTENSNVATVDITVTPQGTPDAVDDELTTDEDIAVEFPGTFLLANDTDPYDVDLTIADIDTTSAEGGTIEDIGSGYYRYTPPANFFGTDTFTYTVTNGSDTDTATVTVTVNPVEDEGSIVYLPIVIRVND